MVRYRIFDSKGLIATLEDNFEFDMRFIGKNPSNPVGGTVTIEDKEYPIVKYHEFHSSSFTENEFHELDQNWFAHVFVENILD